MTSRTYIAWLTSCVQHLRCSWASTTAWWRCSHPLQGRNWLAPSGSSEAGCSTMQHQKLDDFDGDWNHQLIWVVCDIAAYFMENGWNMAQIWIDVSEKMENHSKLLNYQRVPQFMVCYDILWQFMTKKTKQWYYWEYMIHQWPWDIQKMERLTSKNLINLYSH